VPKDTESIDSKGVDGRGEKEGREVGRGVSVSEWVTEVELWTRDRRESGPKSQLVWAFAAARVRLAGSCSGATQVPGGIKPESNHKLEPLPWT
jgi:hypothetical protein